MLIIPIFVKIDIERT